MSSPCFPSCPRVAVVWAGHLSDERVVDHSIGKQLRKLTIKELETQLMGWSNSTVWRAREWASRYNGILSVALIRVCDKQRAGELA